MRRALTPALLLTAALLLAGPTAAWCASVGQGMAVDTFDSFTKSPAARQGDAKSPGASKTGPVAPTPPKAPVVPGAAAQDVAEPSLLQKVGQTQQPSRANQSGPARKPAPQARQQVLALSHDGQERRALLSLPKAAPARKSQPALKLPLIIFLHGAGGSAAQAMRQTGLAERAAAAGFLAAFPEGLGPAGANGEGQTWNAWTCCGYARDQRVDDVGFLSALINRLRADFNADPRRVYLAGFSNGAMLASRFVLERPGAAAALASVAGYLPCDAERPAEPLPVLVIHGGQDQVARFAPTAARPATGRFCEDYPARAQVEFWVRGLNLSAKAKVQDGARSPARVEEYAPAQKGGRGLVRFVIVKAGGHAWPGGPRERYRYCDLPSQGVDATGLVLEFFKRQPASQAGSQEAAQGTKSAGKSAPAKKKARER